MNQKYILVTGASRGIGRSIALKFAREGYHVFLNCRTSLNELEEVQNKILSMPGGSCTITTGDVGDPDQVRRMFQEIHKICPGLDVLVNNAGITKDMLLMRMTEEQFDSVIQTNLKGTFNMIRHASSIMLKQRSGAIINMSSVVGVMGNVGQANYAASKAGIIGLTKSTAKELAARGVTCNAIAPGFVETDMTAALSEDLQKQMLETIPLKRYGQVDDIAQAAVFLAKNTYITGQVLHVDGGMCM